MASENVKCPIDIKTYAMMASFSMASLLAAAMAQMSTPKTGDNISHGVADLLCCSCGGTADAHHLHNVDTWVGQPRDGGQEAGLADQSTCTLRLSLGGCAQTDEELEEHVAERQHRKSPPHPAALRVILDLTRVAQGNHCRRGNSKGP